MRDRVALAVLEEVRLEVTLGVSVPVLLSDFDALVLCEGLCVRDLDGVLDKDGDELPDDDPDPDMVRVGVPESDPLPELDGERLAVKVDDGG